MARVIYDGDCGFCTTSANWLEARSGGDVDVVPFQHLSDEALASYGITRADCETAAYRVGDGAPKRGHRAVAAALRDVGGGWSALGRIIDLPPVRPLAAGAYALVSRFRHRLPGGTPACRLPDAGNP